LAGSGMCAGGRVVNYLKDHGLILLPQIIQFG
jgi:hypothetical protein